MPTQDIEEVITTINTKFEEGIKIISIDGWTGAGKSTLLGKFNESETLSTLALDDYFEKKTGLYLEVFKYDDLKEKTNELLEANKKILIEGICMEHVLGEMNVKTDYKVYIKELNLLDEWYYEKYLDESKTEDEIFKEDDEFLKDNIFEEEENSSANDEKFEDDEMSKERKGLFYDVVRYHRNFKPQINCDLLFERPYEEH